MLIQWENDHERHFVVHDNRYLDVIEKQWEEKNLHKEQEKVKRVRDLQGADLKSLPSQRYSSVDIENDLNCYLNVVLSSSKRFGRRLLSPR